MSHSIEFNRRHLLGLLGSTMAFSAFGTAKAATTNDPRLITILLRGGVDGLSFAPPIGDPNYASMRGDLAYPPQGEGAGIRLNDLFALHPALVNMGRLYESKQLNLIHACATPYRERSHFDGQDVLEAGKLGAGRLDSGWMNRLTTALQGKSSISALSVGSTTPLIMRGPADVLGWAPSNLKPVDDDLPLRLMNLYSAIDPDLAKSLNEGLATQKAATGIKSASSMGSGPSDPKTMKIMAQGAANLMAQETGPRLAALSFEGWDTHVLETQRLSKLLKGLDDAVEALRVGLGPVWDKTSVVIMTEFGRTVAINGTGGSDHGTGTAAFVLGGAMPGGRIYSDWPGLKTSALYEARDLMPTTSLWSVLKGQLIDHMDLSASVTNETIFPDSASIAPLKMI